MEVEDGNFGRRVWCSLKLNRETLFVTHDIFYFLVYLKLELLCEKFN